MFEQTFLDDSARGVRPWTICVSLLMQVSLVGVAILAPLFFTYNPPMDWVRSTLLLAPPPPPQPPPPAAAAPAPKAPVPVRFESILTAPAVIPENAVLLRDANDDTLDGLQAPDLGGIRGGVAGGVMNGVLGVTSTLKAPERPIVVGGNVQAAKIVSRVSPEYPVEAVALGLSGVVYLQAVITKDGVIREIKLISGHPILAESAMEAVKQWRYRPTILNGNPVEVMTQIEVKFQLADPPAPAADPKSKKGKRR